MNKSNTSELRAHMDRLKSYVARMDLYVDLLLRPRPDGNVGNPDHSDKRGG